MNAMVQSGPRPRLVIASQLPGAGGGLAVAAAVGVAMAFAGDAVVVVEVGAARRRGPTMLASAEARALEAQLRAAGHTGAAARGRVCWLPLAGGREGLEDLRRVLSLAGGGTVLAHVPVGLWPLVLEGQGPAPASGLIRADLPADRALAALAVAELCERKVRARIAARPLGRVAARRALAGLEPGGAASRRAARLAAGLTVPA